MKTRKQVTVLAVLAIITLGFTACGGGDPDPGKTFTVTFNLDGGNIDGETANVQRTANSGGTVASMPANPSKADNAFGGWYTQQNGAGTPFTGSTTVTADITVYAKWSVIPPGSHKVTFVTNDGTPVNDQTVTTGGKVDPVSTTRDGYTLVGWYTEETFETEWDFDTDTVSAAITLYAKWNAIPTHTITFDADNGSTPTAQTVTEGNNANKPTDPAKFNDIAGLYEGTPDNYTFIGWYKPDDTEWNFTGDIVDADITLKAKWNVPTASPIDISSFTGNNNLDKVMYYTQTLGYPGPPVAYTLLLDDDINTEGFGVGRDNLSLTLIGIGTERIIQFIGPADEYFFYFPFSTSLIIGQNITLKGNNASYLIEVGRQGSVGSGPAKLVMLEGSKITECTARQVVLIGNGDFIMEGGEIIGNISSRNDIRGASVSHLGGEYEVNKFTMNGGKITGNTSAYNGSSPADVYLRVMDTINLSGNAEIGTLLLEANNSINNVITISGDYTGCVATLNLYGDSFVSGGVITGPADINAVISWWENKTIIQTDGNRVLTSADIAKFHFGNFYSTSTGETQPIGTTHKIATSGAEIGKLVRIN